MNRTSTYKTFVAQKVASVLNRHNKLKSFQQIWECINVNPHIVDGRISYFLPINVDWMDSQIINDFTKFKTDIDVTVEKRRLSFAVNKNQFINDTLQTCPDVYPSDSKLTVVIDFSSPNIAKPFHFGHLRSTIVGNFISNITSYMQHRTIRLNYLGDWGLQFGLLEVGLQQMAVSDGEMKRQPIRRLFEAYVLANKMAEESEQIGERARDIFYKMETTVDDDRIEKWKLYRQLTLDELKRIYSRLGIVFDEYSWESDYSAVKLKGLIDDLKNRGILIRGEDNVFAVDVEHGRIPFLKSDGTTLYLSRDVGAAQDRFARYNFDRMLYVVDSTQSKHFHSLFAVLRRMGASYADRLQHVRFGRVLGMSTRTGNVVFLDDILNEIRNRTEWKQVQALTTKGEIGGETADVLGISTLLINDLRRRRVQDYEFSWELILKTDGYTGIKIQYCHCRLCSLEANCGSVAADSVDPDALKEKEALNLIIEIARFDDCVLKSYKELDACILVVYLFNLTDAINKAFKVLRVKGEDSHVASQRLLLFNIARTYLNRGMRIIGMKPLTEM